MQSRLATHGRLAVNPAMPLVSVILPTCDRPLLLRRALASVLAQQGVELECVVVDNNRDCPSVAAQPELKVLLADPRVNVVGAQAAESPAGSRNAGLRAARGEWVTYLDDDDEYAAGKLAAQLACAERDGAPLVLCGYEVRLGPRRRLIQTTATMFTGDRLLLDAVWGTPFLFHRSDPEMRFDETMRSAEDFDFAQRYLARHDLTHVPCVPEPLVIVHPQAGPRINTRHADHWRAVRRVLGVHRARYSRAAVRCFLLRALLQRYKGPSGSWPKLLAAGCRLVRLGGTAEARRVLNAWLYRTGLFARWLVS